MASKEILASLTEAGIVPVVRGSRARKGGGPVRRRDGSGRGNGARSGNRAHLHAGRRGVLRDTEPARFDDRDGQALLQGRLPGRAHTDRSAGGVGGGG